MKTGWYRMEVKTINFFKSTKTKSSPLYSVFFLGLYELLEYENNMVEKTVLKTSFIEKKLNQGEFTNDDRTFGKFQKTVTFSIKLMTGGWVKNMEN